MTRRFWQLLVSVRTALVLILLLAAATLAGTTIMQVPANIPLGGPEHAQWIEKVRPRFGSWTDTLAVLQLFNVFRSWWFETLAVALVASASACSIHRWRVISREVLRPPVRLAAAMFERPGTVAVDVPASARDTGAALAHALGASRYRVVADDRSATVHVYADRGRFARFGSVVAHASLVLLLAAAAIGGRIGYSDDGFVVPEGSTRDVGLDGLSVHVDSFVAEYYPTGQPKDFRSELVLSRNGTEVARKTIRVNDPLEYEGVRFYQSFFGPAAYIRVTDPAGSTVYDDAVALAWRVDGDRPAGTFTLPGRGLTAYVVAPSTGGKGDALIAPGEMRLEVYRDGSSEPLALQAVAQGKDVEVAGLRFTFLRERQFTGLRVARDPTVPLIWTGSSLFVLGITAVFLFPYRRLWARVTPRAQGGSRMSLLTVGRRDADAASELERIAEETARAAAEPRAAAVRMATA